MFCSHNGSLEPQQAVRHCTTSWPDSVVRYGTVLQCSEISGLLTGTVPFQIPGICGRQRWVKIDVMNTGLRPYILKNTWHTVSGEEVNDKKRAAI
jgi:hypothetical protein